MAADTRTSGAPAAYFDDYTGAVHFWVHAGSGVWTGAMVRKEVLHFRFDVPTGRDEALRAYADHRAEIESAVLRRLATGSLEPVLLRETDFGPR